MADRDTAIRIGDDPFKISYMEYDTDRYEEYLQSKIDTVMAKLPSSIQAQILMTDVIRSPVKHFRQRCRFAVMPSGVNEIEVQSHSHAVDLVATSMTASPNVLVPGQTSDIASSITPDATETAADTSSKFNDMKTLLTYVLWENGGPNVYVDAFPIASITIYDAMPLFLGHIQTIEVLRNNLRAINFLSTRSGDLLATLVYDFEIGGPWEKMATEMCNEMGRVCCFKHIQFKTTRAFKLLPSFPSFLPSLLLSFLPSLCFLLRNTTLLSLQF